MSLTLPKITWGSGYTKTLNIGYPVDNWSSYSQPREGSEWVYTLGGIEDSWVIDNDYFLECDVRWIPTSGSSPSGWWSTDGWDDFMQYVRAKNTFRWYPDKDSATYIESYLVEPLGGGPALEPDGTKTIRLIMRNTGSAYTGY